MEYLVASFVLSGDRYRSYVSSLIEAEEELARDIRWKLGGGKRYRRPCEWGFLK